MRKETADGAGTLLPSTETVKHKKPKKLRPTKQPDPAAAPSPEESILLALGGIGGGPVRAILIHELYEDRLKLAEVMDGFANLAALGLIVKVADAPEPGDTTWRLTSAGRVTPDPETPPTRGMIANLVPNAQEWPREFNVPGIGAFNAVQAADVFFHVCGVLYDFKDELHDLAASLAASRPWEVAELAEVLVICEEGACSSGMPTDLDHTPIGELSGLRRFAAHAKTHALLKPAAVKAKGGQH